MIVCFMSYICEENMATLNLSSILLFVLIFGFGIYFLVRFISKNQNQKIKATPRTNNITQDFSAFESSPDKFKPGVEENAEEVEEANPDEYTIKGDMSKLEEFLEKLEAAPKDSFDDIQISLTEEEDLFFTIEVDEEKGILAEAFYEEGINISYEAWSAFVRNTIQEYQLELEETKEEEDQYITIYQGNQSLAGFAEIIKKIINNAYKEYANKNLLVEFNHY